MKDTWRKAFAELGDLKNPSAKLGAVIGVIMAVLVVIIVLFNSPVLDSDYSLSKPGSGTTVVEITHRGLVFSSGIKFSCSSATIDYASRQVVMNGVFEIGSMGKSKGWVGLFSMQGDHVAVQLDSDEKYKIQIGKIRCSMK